MSAPVYFILGVIVGLSASAGNYSGDAVNFGLVFYRRTLILFLVLCGWFYLTWRPACRRSVETICDVVLTASFLLLVLSIWPNTWSWPL